MTKRKLCPNCYNKLKELGKGKYKCKCGIWTEEELEELKGVRVK